MKKGKLIVIDGTDGSGKATQTELLAKRLKKEGKRVMVIDFPQYENNFFGCLIGECLRGDYGDFIGVDPHIASVLYAADRWEASKRIKSWLAKGYIVLCDRYVSSNQIHQGSKISDNKKRKEFLIWLDKLEFDTFAIPRPDLIIFLDMPTVVTQKLLQSAQKKKIYLRGKSDQAENNPEHLEKSRQNAIKLVRELNNWRPVSCAADGQPRSRENIHEDVWRAITKK